MSVKSVATALSLLVTAAALYAQVVPGGVNPPPPRTELPYSAETLNISDRILADGNRIHRESHGKVYRDSFGRTRSETQIVEPANVPPFTRVHIEDPVRRVRIELDEITHTAQVEHYPDPVEAHERTAVAIASTKARQIKSAREELGTQSIEGCLVRGTRTTWTIPAKAEGNEQPIITTSENWTCDELHVGVLSKSEDPRSGTSEYRVFNIQRVEPDPALFQAPADYRVKDNGNPQ